MSASLLLFDLDETVAPDQEANAEVFEHVYGELFGPGPESTPLFAVFEALIQPLWQGGPAAEYCDRIGISAWEGLWGPFGPSEQPMLALLHTWVPGYRLAAWQRLATELGAPTAKTLRHVLEERFLRERRARQRAYPWSAEVLRDLASYFRLGMITNGAPDLQRLKLEGTGLADLFDPLVVSGDLDIGKPERAIFAHALRLVGVEPGEAVMIGDSWARDMLGASGAGLRGVWVNPPATPTPMHADATRVVAIRDLRELPAALVSFGEPL
jgi:putative hydrolase of the HAD superfamily